MSQALRDAREYEEITERRIENEVRPEFHLSARVGWLNDPNGFSFYNGKYHLFYQYHPYDSHWGPMHWGHAVSEDLLHWTHLPAALAPDTVYDEAGCFSGSALTLLDGRHLLMYTGVCKEVQSDGTLRDIQTQCIAIGDGKEYEKYQGNPVLNEKNLPDNASKYDFRDPKIWKASDGTYRCVVANCTEENDGQILLYSSSDGMKWKYEKVLILNNKRYGKMWECPDFFALDGKQVLIVSPMNMLPKGLEYHNGNGTLCLIGSYDEKEETFIEEQNQAIDYGIDFYAPQTTLTPDGRRIMIGWMQNWATSSLHSKKKAWFGQMSIPRELSIVNERLIQKPIRELESLRRKKVEYENVVFSGVTKLKGIEGRKIDMELSVRPVEEENTYHKFAVRFAQDSTYHTSVSFCPEEAIVEVDRELSGSREDIIHQRQSYVNHRNGEIKFRIILDAFSAEIFVNDGEHVLSTTIYTDQSADGVSFFADGTAAMDVVKYELG